MRYLILALTILFAGNAAILHAASIQAPLTEQQHQAPAMQTAPPAAPSAAQKPPEILDIKGPIVLPDNSKIIFLTAAALAALLLLTLLILWWRKRAKKQQQLLAHETALKQLQQASRLIKEHKVSAFVSLIDQTMRTYIEQRFGISARRQTTREFISAITDNTVNMAPALIQHKPKLQTWLEHCDMVKFARGDLDSATMQEMLANLRAFITSTPVEPEK